MKKLTQILLLFVGLFNIVSCGNIKKSSGTSSDLDTTKFSYAYYKTSNTNEYTIYEIPVLFTQKTNDSLNYNMEYVRYWNNYVESKIDTVKFKFNEKHIENSIFYHGQIKYKEFSFSQKRTYTNGAKTYPVYKFYYAPHTTDIGNSYFWTPEFGIILIRSLHWENIMKLECHKSGTLSKELDQLCDMVLFDKTNFFMTTEDLNL